METHHRIITGDARNLSEIPDGSVELIVTSPPYPMIELWDDLFIEFDPVIGNHLSDGAGQRAFERMHDVLEPVWEEVERVLVDGGIACINVGDATRRLDGGFRRYANHTRITTACEDLGLVPLPVIHWHKPTNAATKFMGSGMLPPNAYVTQEHEQILVFRNGEELRNFEPGDSNRYRAAYFWEERNDWFSDHWTDVSGRSQDLLGELGRDRAAAFPFEIPFRLINMYSVYGDSVLDPFWGTGTTTLASMAAGRHSIGVEIDPSMDERFEDRVPEIKSLANEVAKHRLDRHQSFVQEAREDGGDLPYYAEPLDMPVKTAQEEELCLYGIESVERRNDEYHVRHERLQETIC